MKEDDRKQKIETRTDRHGGERHRPLGGPTLHTWSAPHKARHKILYTGGE
jgi:hypothetical protein